MLTKKTLPEPTQAHADESTASPQGLRKITATLDSGTIPTAVPGSLERPDSRTRSIWLTQLMLTMAIVIITVLVLALSPETVGHWYFGAGVVAIITLTVVTLAVPWSRLPRNYVLVVPFIDALAVGLIAANTELRFGYIWVLPVMWVAMHFGADALAGLLATICAILIVVAGGNPSPEAALRLVIVVLSLSFIGITAHLATRRARALRALLRRQAVRLNRTVERRSDQERRTTEILNGIDTAVARITLSGRVLAINNAYAELYAIDPADTAAPARSIEYDGLRGMPIPPSERPLARAGRGEIFTDVRVWLFTPDGEWRVLSVTSKRLAATESEGTTMLLLAHDVTAITHAQRERERLTAIASHELKHPLTVLISTADLALESDELTPRIRERLETMLHASERMLDMTTSMLRTSRTAFSARDAQDDIDLRQLLWDSVDSFRPTAAAHDVELRLIADEPLLVIADGFRLRQVIDNLVSNAIKYTPANGGVRVEGRSDGDHVSLVFADTGIGISKADISRITTPYFRTDAAKDTAGGTGLGLSIAKEIVTAHGGSLAIESTLGAGTKIEVRLPRGRHATVGAPAKEERR